MEVLVPFLIFKDAGGSTWFIAFLYQMLLETYNKMALATLGQHTRVVMCTRSSSLCIIVPKEFGLIWRTLNKRIIVPNFCFCV